MRFLAEAGQALAASLDWEQTLMQVARLAVPALADWCIVDVLEEDGVTIKQVAVAAADPRKEDLLREMRMLYPPTIDSPQPAARSIRSGEPGLFEEFGAGGAARDHAGRAPPRADHAARPAARRSRSRWSPAPARSAR